MVLVTYITKKLLTIVTRFINMIMIVVIAISKDLGIIFFINSTLVQ